MTTLIPKFDLMNGGTTPTGAINRSVNQKLQDSVSVKDFGAIGDGAADDTMAITNALAAALANGYSIKFPAGTYLVTNGFVVGSGVSIVFDPDSSITFNSTNSYIFQLKPKSSIYGNNARITITNASWNGSAIYLNGADHFYEPTIVDGLNIWGNPAVHAANNLGTAIYMVAPNAADVISWTKFTNMTLYGLNYAISIDSGTSGSAGDSTTWHWINANTFNNIDCYQVNNAIALRGLNSVPAECTGNFFNNITIQTESTGLPIYVSGASSNYINCYIFDFFGKNSITFDSTVSQPNFNRLICNSRLEDITVSGPQHITSLYGQLEPSYHCVATTDRSGVYNAYTAVGTTSLFSGNQAATTGQVYGSTLLFSGQSPNNTGSYFASGTDATSLRYKVYSNGGIANYQANNVNLSDATVKKDITPAKNYLSTLTQVPVVTFLFNDQTDTETNLGVTAQSLQAVAPELVGEMDIGTVKNPNIKLAIYETDLKYAMLKAIQELSVKVTALEEQVINLGTK